MGWKMKGMLQGIAVSAGVAFLFYRSVWALLLGTLWIPACLMRCRKRDQNSKRRQLEKQFIAGIQSISGFLQAGYSLENACRNTQKEVDRLYGTDAVFCVALRQMNQRVAMNEAFDDVLMDFANDCGVEDIRNFAEILRYARRSGGNIAVIIRQTVTRMQEKAEILEEIENAVAAKKMEQKLMNVLLPGILLFLTISSPVYSQGLYHNLPGLLLMSGCLGGYLACVLWSEKIVAIQV